jgi:hypothetical protein
MTARMRILTAAAAMLGVAAWPHCAPGATGPPCGNRKDVVAYLENAYHESQAGRGLRSDNLMVELLVGPRGSWTIIVTHPLGMSCLVSEGDDWEMTAANRHEAVARDAESSSALH